jgi:HSP20 family protein
LRLSKAPTWVPPAEVYETPQEYVVQIELAGLAEEDISVNHINNLLVVRGTRRFRRASQEAQYHNSERSYGTFERLFPLPSYVRPSTLETDLSNGIFEIKLSKTEIPGVTEAKSSAKESGTQKSAQEKKK